MSAKFTLTAAPTFSALVQIPVHGGESAPVKFEFKHRTKAEMDEWLESIKGMPDAQLLGEFVSGWDLDDKCEQASFDLLTQNYSGAASAIVSTYIKELLQAREKN